jgi:hypothetical protein
MAGASFADKLRSILSSINPRRSLGRIRDVADYRFSGGVLDCGRRLVGSVARENVLQQHIRRHSLETDQLSSDFTQALTAGIDAVRSVGPILRPTNALGQPSALDGVFRGTCIGVPAA